MEKVKKYKSIVLEVLNIINNWEDYPNDPVKGIIIEDDKNGHYLFFTDGWINYSRFYHCYVHITIKSDGKVWLMHDGTEYKVGQMLIERGILKSDIVVGWHAPDERPLTEFAIG